MKKPNIVIFNPDQYRGENREIILNLKERLLTFYLETSDVVPHNPDERSFRRPKRK